MRLSLRKKVWIILAYGAGFIAVAALTVVVLHAIEPKKNDPVAQAPNQQQLTQSVETIDTLASHPPASLQKAAVERPAVADFGVRVSASDANSYTIFAPAQAVVVFNAYSLDIPAETIMKESEIAFTKLGFETVATGDSNVSMDSMTFKNDAVICQVSVQASEIATTTYSCTSDSKSTEERSTIKVLTDLYNTQASDDKKITSPSLISRTTLNRDGVTGSVLSVQYPQSEAPKKGAVLLFGAINDEWQFVADLSSGKSNGKTNIPAGNTDMITDAKWKGVLAELTGVGN